MNIKIEYRNIANMNLRILDGETVLVRANPRYTKDDILAFVERKRAWIEKHQTIQKETAALMEDGPDVFWLLGEKLKIVMRASEVDDFYILDGEAVALCAPGTNPAMLLNRYMSNYVQTLLNERVDYCVSLFVNLKRPNVEVKQIKSKWGVCYYREARIVLNAALLHAPLHCIDFVVLHELTHFYFPDHQKGFHQAMARVMPRYKEYEKELRRYEQFLKKKQKQ